VAFDSGELGFNGNQGSIGNAPASNRSTWQTPQNLSPGTYTYFCRIHPFMRGAFRVETQSAPSQTLLAKKKQKLRKAEVTETLDKPGTVLLEASIKASKKAGASRRLDRALDESSTTISVNPKVATTIKLTFSRAARKMIKRATAKGRSGKVVVTATATDKWGKASTSQARFKLVH
jgi:hypothetical protein